MSATVFLSKEDDARRFCTLVHMAWYNVNMILNSLIFNEVAKKKPPLPSPISVTLG